MSDNPEDLDDEPVILMSTCSKNPIDPIEGTSSSVITIVDESSNDSGSSTPPNPGEVVTCEKCKSTANLSLFKQKTSAIGGKQEDIFRNYCNQCNNFFGMCSKKVRGTFAYVTEEGRILTNAEKMELLRKEKRKMSLSRTGSEIMIEDTPSDTSTNDNSNDIEKEESEEKDESLPKKKKPQKKQPFDGKRKKTNWSNIGRVKRKKEQREKQSLSVEKPTSSSVRSSATSTSKKPEKTNTSDAATSGGEKKRGRPFKLVSKIPTTPKAPISKVVVNPIAVTKECSDSGAQTDNDMLLKSTYLSDVFEETMRGTFSERISARLQGQPLILRKEFFVMIRTIQEQDALIVKFRGFEEKYKQAIEQFKNFGRTTRLAYSDDLRNIRADMIERKEEFKAHQAEVVSIMKKQREKYEAYKEQVQQKFEDHRLEMANMEAKVAYLEEDRKFEFERAEFLLRSRDVYEKERNEAVEASEAAIKKLNDRLWVANNEKCAHCQAVEKVRKTMMVEMADMTAKTEIASGERDQAVEKARLFESAAQKLGKDCDTIKYERDSWKAYAEKFKKEINKLTQTIKEKEKELFEKTFEVSATTPRRTPKSVVCTPSDNDRVSPPEEGEILDTPPQASPMSVSRAPQKPLAQIVAEKNAALPIAAGFESWITKDQLDAPAPSIPKARTAFGPPSKTPQQFEAEKMKLAMANQQTPWERASQPVATSSALSEALAKVQAESFLGSPSSKQSSYASKSYAEEMNRIMQSRKRAGEPSVSDEPKKIAAATPIPQKKIKQAPPQNSPSPYKIAPATPVYNSSSSAGVGSLTNMKKIPKLSEKPPQAEFALALGIKSESSNSGIPGLGFDDDDKVKEKETPPELGKIMPAAPKITETKPADPKPNVKPKVVPSQQGSNPKQNAAKSTTVKAEHPASSNATPVRKLCSTLSNASSSASSSSQKLSNQQQNIQKQNLNNHQTAAKKKKKKSKQWADHSADPSPWDNRPPVNTQMKPAWGQSQPQNFYGNPSIQQLPSNSNQGRFPSAYNDDRPWSDSLQRNNGRPGDTESFSALPWHRAQDTPFGKVPIQESFGIGNPRPQPQPFYGHPQQPTGFYSPPQRRYSPPPASMRNGYPSMYSQPPAARNPRSFYG